MISDVLSEAVAEMNASLDEPVYAQVYQGELRRKILAVRDAMDALRQALDTPPSEQKD